MDKKLKNDLMDLITSILGAASGMLCAGAGIQQSYYGNTATGMFFCIVSLIICLGTLRLSLRKYRESDPNGR